MDSLLILGAGADRTAGIDFPLASTLLPDVAQYLEGPGKEVDIALRTMIPGLRFSFSRMIAHAVDEIATRDSSEQKKMVQRVQAVLKNLPADQEHVRKHGELIVRLFNKLATIAEENYLDDDTVALIREVFPDDADELIDNDAILDIQKLSLSDTFKTVLKRTLRMGLSGQRHAVADALGAEMLNIEQLLVEKFLGFYNEKSADIKNYLYISWALWAFLVDRQNAVLREHKRKKLPFYGSLPKGLRAVTLNYTAFAREALDASNVIHFHGGLAEYVRMDTRNLLPIEDLTGCDPAKFIKETIAPNIDLVAEDTRDQRHVIPSFVPPLRLKPVLSRKYIDIWAQAAEWIGKAKHIVAVGYSFNGADEHFNDILRCSSNPHVDVVAPDANSPQFMARMEKVFNRPAGQFDVIKLQGHNALQSRGIRLIPAKAADIDVGALLKEPARA
jgi:hypothetical protein